jgi:hypothetical protein
VAALQQEIAAARRESMQRQLAERERLLDQLVAIGAERIVVAERAPGRDYQQHYYANFGYSCVDPDYWLHGADGGRLLVLNLRTRSLEVLLDDPGGAVRDPQVHYGGQKILFSYRRCGACHSEQQLPRHVTAQIPLDPWGDMLAWTRPLSRYSRHRIFNLSQPEKSLILLIALAKSAGGLATEPNPTDSGQSVTPRPEEDRSRPPRPVAHPIVFTTQDDQDYRAILTHIQAAHRMLNIIKRFDMPGFQPNEHYIREMKRYGILPASLDVTASRLDPYETDRRYWGALSSGTY